MLHPEHRVLGAEFCQHALPLNYGFIPFRQTFPRFILYCPFFFVYLWREWYKIVNEQPLPFRSPLAAVPPRHNG